MKPPIALLTTTITPLTLALALALPQQQPQAPPTPSPPTACPNLHIFGARETTAPPGLGTAQTLIDLLLSSFPGSTAEPIVYPAAGGPNYTASVTSGVASVIRQTAEFSARCPETILIAHGYSQGGQIIDNAYCGGPDFPSLNTSAGVSLVTAATARNTVAIILMGNPRFVPGLVFNVGDARVGGFAARPPDFQCPRFQDRIQSYCDSPDPFCSNGTDAVHHQEYGNIYGKEALKFIVGRIIVS